MFIARVRSKGKQGKSYESVLLRESIRVGSKVSSRTLAVLTKLPQWLINSIDSAIRSQRGDEPLSAGSTSPAESIAALNHIPEAGLRIHQGESFGALWLLHSVAEKLGITKALGPKNCPKHLRSDRDHDCSQIALWRVCARLLVPGISLLGTTRLVSQTAARRLFAWCDSWDEDDLYEYHGTWLENRHIAIEKSLWRTHQRRQGDSQSSENLFLYDVTSSYFEGICNVLSAFGYNRDLKSGKMQVVVGLLADSTGEPCAIKVYSGDTRDFATFGDALERTKTDFGCDCVVMVGDRGMIKSEQIASVKNGNDYYISALTKPQIQKLLRTNVFQIELFDESIAEVIDRETGERFVLRRNPVRQEEMRLNRRERQKVVEKKLREAMTYLQERPRAKVEVQLRELQTWIKKLKLNKWLTVEKDPEKPKAMRLVTDEQALKEEEKLDGCYAIRTNLNSEQCSSETVHDRYKDLARVEEDFRTMKTAHLEIRPFYVIKEENTHAHALTCMLALKIRRYLADAWKELNLTVEECLEQLGHLSILEIENPRTGEKSALLPEPTPLQKRLLSLAGVTLPKKVPAVQAAPVVTRKKLQDERTAA